MQKTVVIMRYCLFLILLVSFCAFGQDIDTTKVERVVNMQQVLDSLRLQIRNMDSELQRIKGNMVNQTSDVDELLSLLGEEQEDMIPDSVAIGLLRVPEERLALVFSSRSVVRHHSPPSTV